MDHYPYYLKIRQLAENMEELDRLKRRERMQELIEGLVGLILGILAAALLYIMFLPFAIYNVFAISMLWRWFGEPLFHIPTPSMAEIYGLVLLWAILHRSNLSFDKKKWFEILIIWLTPPTSALLVGWIVHTWFV